MVILLGIANETDSLHRIDASRNMARFYELWLQPDLVGRNSPICAWRRIGTTGRVRSISFAELPAANAAKIALCRRKSARGYTH